MPTEYNRGRGILFLLASAFFFSTMSAFSRLAGAVPVMQKMLFRNLIAVIVVGAILVRNRQKLRLKPGTLKMHLLRSLFGTLGVLGNFYAVDHMILSDATMLVEMSPFFIILLSSLFLGERASLQKYALILLAFIGAGFVIKPSPAILSESGTLVAVGASICAGAAYMMVRALSLKGENGTVIIFFFSVFSCVTCFPSVFLQPTHLTAYQVVMLLLTALFGCLGQFAVTAAYRYAPASEISIFDYSQIIFAALYGWILFDQMADGYSYIGYLLIVAAAIVMYLMDRRAAEKRF